MAITDSKLPIKVACTGLIMGVGLVLVAKRVWSRRLKRKPSGDWKQVGTVTELNLYPVKSFKGIKLDEARVTSIGIEDLPQEGRMVLGDRRMVIYKGDSLETITARTYPQMLQATVEAVSEDEILLTYKDQQLKVKTPNGSSDRKIRLWTEQVPLVDAGDEAASWLQNVVFDGKPNFRLGFWPGVQVRRDISHLQKKFEAFYPFMRNDFTGAFSDLSSILLINESSVADLNARIAERSEDPNSEEQNSRDPVVVSPTNFRGNIVVKGPSAFEEDEWSWVRIGDHTVLRNFKPCTRCSLTTINPQTSEKDANFEPLTTLKTYRQLDEKIRKLDTSPVMGVYLGVWTEGQDRQADGDIIKVGDPVYVCN